MHSNNFFSTPYTYVIPSWHCVWCNNVISPEWVQLLGFVSSQSVSVCAALEPWEQNQIPESPTDRQIDRKTGEHGEQASQVSSGKHWSDSLLAGRRMKLRSRWRLRLADVRSRWRGTCLHSRWSSRWSDKDRHRTIKRSSLWQIDSRWFILIIQTSQILRTTNETYIFQNCKGSYNVLYKQIFI